MDNRIQWIPHAKTVELRLTFAEQKTSFTLLPGRPIPDKSLDKIHNWFLEKLHPVQLESVMAYLRGFTVVAESRQCLVLTDFEAPGKPGSEPGAGQVTSPYLDAYCDYSRQDSVTVWACVITGMPGKLRVCGQVPAGHCGEHYAALRTLHYLYQTGRPGTIWCDERTTAQRLGHWFPVRHIPRTDTRHKQAHHLARAFAAALAAREKGSEWQSALAHLEPAAWPQMEFISRDSAGGWRAQVAGSLWD